RYPDRRSFFPTRVSGRAPSWRRGPGPIRGGRPMRQALRTAVLALAVLTLGTAPARAVDQAKIDKAIERGVAALKELQERDGTWPHVPGRPHAKIGATALAGLTLLECNVPENNKSIVAAADVVRRASLTLTYTYSLSLSILF